MTWEAETPTSEATSTLRAAIRLAEVNAEALKEFKVKEIKVAGNPAEEPVEETETAEID